MSKIPRIQQQQAGVFSSAWLAGRERGHFLSGCEELNRLTGGIPHSSIVEICGQGSAGRTGLVYSILSPLLDAGHVCAYIDGTNAFDPHSAFLTELNFAGLLWTKCSGSLEKTLKAADAVLHAGGFSLIVLDLADFETEQLRQIPLSYWYRFQRTIEKQPATLLVLSKLPLTRRTAVLVINCQSPEPQFYGAAKLSVLSRIKTEITINRPAPRRKSYVLLKSYFWLEQGNVCRYSLSRK